MSCQPRPSAGRPPRLGIEYNPYVRVSEALRNTAVISGWDWSGQHTRMAPLGWSYPDLLTEYVVRSVRALDVGTGGGEIFSVAARSHDVAVDIDPVRLDVARGRLDCFLVRADQDRLPFQRHSFDLISARHTDAPPSEVVRVLQPGGIYLTQQPGGHICQNIFDALGWGSNEQFWRREAAHHGFEFRDTDSRIADYERLGCRIVRSEEAYVDYEFLDPEALAFWLANAPLPAIDLDAQADVLDALPLQTNWHAHLLIVQTPTTA
jgi:SAM-dependent methyltransferase